jgi:hypothetical protein
MFKMPANRILIVIMGLGVFIMVVAFAFTH